MTNLVETSNWDAGVYEIQTTDAVVGDDGTTLGIANQPGQNLVNRTLWLRERIAAAITQAGLAEGTSDNQQLAEAVVLQCASAVALRSVPVPVVPNAQTVLMMTRGQAADGDGLAAIYKWVYNSTTADNGSTVIAPTGQATGRWVACGINATKLAGAAATSYLTTAVATATYETITDATAKLAAAETFATGAATTAQSNAETYAAGVATTAQNNAEVYAAGVASTALSNAEAYAAMVAANAQNAAVASSESFASSVAAAAQAAAETYANGTLLSDGWKLPGGFYVQGGIAAGIPGAPGTQINFPTPFPTACFAVVACAYGGNATVTVLSFTRLSFQLINGASGDCTWIAIGR